MNRLWSGHDIAWRDPAQIVSQWRDAAEVDPAILRYTVRGHWWDIIEEHRLVLLVSREYEHLLMALAVSDGRPSISFVALPHPSGIAIDHKSGLVYVASTRNPNQIFDFAPVSGAISRLDNEPVPELGRPLVPVRSRFYPGSLYLHDLALIDGLLHANAVGENAVVRLGNDASYERVWWPRCIETRSGPTFGRNHIQLNSIAAGSDVTTSYYSASTDRMTSRRPGHRDFPVDRRGVIFDGATREALARGLTRPHSARFHGGELWVDNSGYGEMGLIRNGSFEPLARLAGWTRGLCFAGQIAFVGTSRVIPRFQRYAPGVEVEASSCGVHAVDTRSGQLLGSILWPRGNQIFSVEWVDRDFASGFAFRYPKRSRDLVTRLFYAFTTRDQQAVSPRSHNAFVSEEPS